MVHLRVYAPAAVFGVCVNTAAGLAALGAFLTALFWLVRRRLVFVAPLTVAAAGGIVVPLHLTPVLVTIATNGFSAEGLVKSARKQGQYKGDLFVLGDTCTQTSHRATYLQAPHEVNAQRSSEGSLVRGAELLKNAPRQAAKHLKQNLFEILDRHLNADANGDAHNSAFLGRAPNAWGGGSNGGGGGSSGVRKGPQRLLYLDADTTMNAPLAPLLSAVGAWDPTCSAYLFRERWYAKSLFNGGALLLDRDYSASWLQAWRHELQQHPEFPRDQLALSLAHHKHPELTVCALPASGVSFGADWLTRLRGARATTLTHWTSAKTVVGSDSSAAELLPAWAPTWSQALADALTPTALRLGTPKDATAAVACNPATVQATES